MEQLQKVAVTLYFISVAAAIETMRDSMAMMDQEIDKNYIIHTERSSSITSSYIKCSNMPDCQTIAIDPDDETTHFFLSRRKLKKQIDTVDKNAVVLIKMDDNENMLETGSRFEPKKDVISCEGYKSVEGVTCWVIKNKRTIKFSHDREMETYSKGNEKPPEDISISYKSKVAFIKSAIQDSHYCVQRFYVESRAIHRPDVWFVTVTGKKLKIGDQECHNCESLFSNKDKVSKGYGSVIEKSLLPLRGIMIGDTGDANEYVKITFKKLSCKKRHKEPSEWILQSNHIYFRTKGNKFGSFQTTQEGLLVELKLEHISGKLKCHPGSQSNWGSYWQGKHVILVLITDENDSIIFPANVKLGGNKAYHIDDVSGSEPYLYFKNYATPIFVKKQQKMRIWYGEDYAGGRLENDNSGESCVKVYVKFG